MIPGVERIPLLYVLLIEGIASGIPISPSYVGRAFGLAFPRRIRGCAMWMLEEREEGFPAETLQKGTVHAVHESKPSYRISFHKQEKNVLFLVAHHQPIYALTPKLL